MNKKIIMLCSECFSTTTLYNYVTAYHAIDGIIAEQPMRGLTLAKRRLKKLGFVRVAGQVLFSVLVVPLLRARSKERIARIKQQYRFDETSIPDQKITRLDSVNEERCIALLRKMAPDIVLVNGTRIISKKVLGSVNAVFINMHTGITPKYRGVHGGYWAVVDNDEENCGVTVHLVDKGIDTGGILYQAPISVTREDNFVTYPYLQFGEGIPLVKQAVDDVMGEALHTIPPATMESHLKYHPTIWQYLYFRIFKNKK
ncbi:MAG TPA: formyl transferase [Chitinophagaceae bacterium]|nr:formyl transferase [Chitinophagaceae bacterium]